MPLCQLPIGYDWYCRKVLLELPPLEGLQDCKADIVLLLAH